MAESADSQKREGILRWMIGGLQEILRGVPRDTIGLPNTQTGIRPPVAPYTSPVM